MTDTESIHQGLLIVQGTNEKPAASKALVRFFSDRTRFTGELFIGYPMIGSADGAQAIDAVWISPQAGIVVFDLVEGMNLANYEERQDDAHNKLVAKLQNHKELMARRELLIKVHTITFAPAVGDLPTTQPADYAIANSHTLEASLEKLSWPHFTNHVFLASLSALQSISSIRKSRSRRTIRDQRSRGGKLKDLEDSIATLDTQQSKAVIETVEGVQRIRGLAGSGKTIVLALKAAYLHKQHPDWRIGVTFSTRSLKGQFRKHIYNFCLDGGEEPDWNKIRVINAWGAPGGGERDGIYHEFCRTHEIEYFDFRAARFAFGRENEFSGACIRALDQVKESKKLYDVILVDEAQDLTASFLRLCYEILDDNKRLVYAYDELQNLSSGSLPSPEVIFGTQRDGTPRVQFTEDEPNTPRRDIILDTCYRNSRPVLVTAHALGFGIYREPPPGKSTGLVQMFDHPDLWKDIGYRVKTGSLLDNREVILKRTEITSPNFLERHSDLGDLVQFICCKNVNEQTKWVCNAIQQNLDSDELRHDDIVVINPDPITTRENSGPIRKELKARGIHSHIAGVDTNPDVFFNTETDSITFTGIYRAKGNEAGMVYIINAQDCESAKWNLASIRNRLFTAITRSKSWVRVLGYGPGMERLVEEYNKLREHQFELSFRYPSKEERERLKMVHRDMTDAERQKELKKLEVFTEIDAELESGRFDLEELPPKLLEKIKAQMQKDQKERTDDVG